MDNKTSTYLSNNITFVFEITQNFISLDWKDNQNLTLVIYIRE